ncbi:MAG TPA: nitroreductase family deazaflavin-dependent oxidoreductase [Candidatus Dormibacteraeota bacterium]|jgi:deazaflavin-dependent oxidoreductase (nitroreductase family)
MTYQDFNTNLIKDLRANHGRATSGPFLGRDVLILTTRGARSGEVRENPLVYTRTGEDYVVIASKGGSPEHPGWFHNLLAKPEVVVEADGERFDVVARVAEGEEHDRLYAAQAAKMPAFAEYQLKTKRRIPVVVFRRAG